MLTSWPIELVGVVAGLVAIWSISPRAYRPWLPADGTIGATIL